MYEIDPGDSGPKVLLWRGLGRETGGSLLELLILGGGLIAVGRMAPQGTHLITLCPLDLLGLSFCPGCGLGHAVAYLVRGEFVASLGAHPLGIPAVIILVLHIGHLLRHVMGRVGRGRRMNL